MYWVKELHVYYHSDNKNDVLRSWKYVLLLIKIANDEKKLKIYIIDTKTLNVSIVIIHIIHINFIYRIVYTCYLVKINTLY